ncbi:MAG TPA: type I restriction-modification system subunit M N-terminal domain-containing protein [Ktedonobacterales bacterium]
MPSTLDDLEKRLWDAADTMRANSGLRSSEYSTPVLGLIFLRFADVKFGYADQQLRAELPANSRRTVGPTDYQARGVM